MVGPAINFLFAQVGQRGHRAVVAHTPDHRVGCLSKRPVNDGVIVKEVASKDRDAVACVGIGLKLVAEIAHSLPRLHINHDVTSHDGRQLGRAVVCLRLDLDAAGSDDVIDA